MSRVSFDLNRVVYTGLICLFSTCLFAQDFTMTRKGGPTGATVRDIEIHPLTGDVYVVTQDGVYKSTDNGDTWSAVTGLPESYSSLVDLDIDASGKFYLASNFFLYYSDNGTTWTRQYTSSIFLSNATISLIERTGTSATSPIYMVSNYGTGIGGYGLFRSINNGVTWTQVHSEPSAANRITCIATNALGNVFIYVLGKGILKSSTGSSTYSVAVNGITTGSPGNSGRQSLLYVGSELYAGLVSRIYKTADNGANWTDVTPPGSISAGQSLFATAGGLLYVYENVNSSVHLYSGGVWTTTSFTPRSFALTGFAAKSASSFFLGEDIGISRGTVPTSYLPVNNGIEGLNYNTNDNQSLFTFNSNLYANSHYINKSTDGGTTWTREGFVSAPGPNSTVVLSDGTFMSTSGTSNVRVSFDAGVTWTSKAAPSVPLHLTTDGTTVYSIMSNAKLYTSVDKGDVWTEVPTTGLPVSYFFPSQNSFKLSGNNLFVCVNESSVLKYFSITTAGVATQIASPPSAVTLASNGLREYNGKLYMFSRNGIAVLLSVSSDNGANWSTVTTPVGNGPNYFMTSNGYLVVANSAGQIGLSRDGGNTWLSGNLAFASPNTYTCGSALIDDAGYLNLLYNNDALYVSDNPLALAAPPTNLAVIGHSFHEVRLEWDDNSNNETYFRIDRAIGSNASYDSLTATKFNGNFSKVNAVISVDPQQTYFFKVVAVNGAGKSDYANEVSVAVPARCTTTVPDNRSWNMATLNNSGQGVKAATGINIKSSRNEDYLWTVNIGGTPAWSAPYNTLINFAGTIVENCGAVYLSTGQTSAILPDGNGTWDAANNKLTVKWKLNKGVSTASPISEISEITMNATDPAPISASVPPIFLFTTSNTSIGANWNATIAYGREIALERSTTSGGTYTEVARVNHPATYIDDNSGGLTEGVTYYYRLRVINPYGNVAGAASSIVFKKPFFVGVPVESTHPVSARVSSCFADINNDGWDDYYYSTTSNSGYLSVRSTFLVNQKDGTFSTQYLTGSYQTRHNYNKFVDFNNDGNVDMLAYVQGPLFNGREVFTGDGAGGFTSSQKIATGFSPSALLDYDLDGKLDILTYILGSPIPTLALFRNLGNNIFEQAATVLPGVGAANNMQVFDYDGDSDIDIVLLGAYDGGATSCHILSNNGDGTFTDVANPPFAENTVNGITAGFVGDMDNDGDLDMIAGATATNAARYVYLNNGNGNYTKTTSTLLSEPFTGNTITSMMADIDNDMDLDVMFLSQANTALQVPIYVNNNGTYTRKEGEAISLWAYGRNILAGADVNHDGYIDLTTGSGDREGRFMMNNKLTTGNWTQIILRGVVSNRSAIGAMVKVTAAGVTQTHLVTTQTGGGFGGHSSLTQHFGLGSATSYTVEVTWPNGKVQVVRNQPINEFITIVEDIKGPVATSVLPAHEATNVSSATKLEITLDEPSIPIANRKITVVKLSAPGTVVFTADVTTATVSGNTFSFTLPAKLLISTEYKVSLEAGAFKDIYDNLSPSIGVAAGDPLWNFKIGDGPQTSALSPVSGSIDVHTTATIETTFTGPTTAVAGKFLKIYKQGAPGVPVASVAITAATIAGNKFTFTLPTKLEISTDYTVGVDVGAFMDNLLNESGGVNPGGWVFKTNPGPGVTLFSPTAGATNVHVTAPLEITFDRPVTALAGKFLKVYKTGALGTPVASVATTAATIAGNKLTFTLPTKLEINTDYTVSIDAAAVMDSFLNENAALNPGTWTFKTNPGPGVTLFSPTAGAINVHVTAPLEITFDRPVTAVAGKFLKVYKQEALGAPVASLGSTTATIAGNKLTFTLPAKLEINTDYTVSVDAAAFMDSFLNESAGLNPGTWTFKTNPGPDIIVLSPTAGAANVPVTAPLEITFSRPVTAVADKKLFIKRGSSIVAEVVVATTGVIAGDKYTLAHPSLDFPYAAELSVSIEPGAFIDANQNDYKGLGDGSWLFTTLETPDVIDPVITVDQAAFASLEKGFAPFIFGVTVTDNKSVASVNFFHRKITEKDFINTPATFNTTSQKWEVQVSSAFCDDMGLQYYVVARDPSNNDARSPADVTRYYRGILKFTGNSRPSIAVPSGGTKSSWKIISIPYVLPTSQISQIFAQLNEASSTTWRLLHYQHQPRAWLEYPTTFTTIERGKGYFLNSLEGGSITLDNPIAPEGSRDLPFAMALKKGWNQVGNPYSVTINWNDVISFNGASGNVGQLSLFANGSYTPNPELLSGSGGFVLMQNDATVNISFPGQASTGGRTGNEYGPLGSTDWMVPITLEHGATKSVYGGVGMSALADDGFDEQDGFNPPRFLDFAEMNFSHPEHFIGKFSKDIVKLRSNHEWEFNIESNQEGIATMSWDNSVFGAGDEDLYLFDVASQLPFNMRDVDHYSFDPSYSRTFRVFFGKNLEQKLKSNRVVLGQAYPNPVSSTATIPFSLPEHSPAYTVRVEIFDVMGRLIETLLNKDLNPGYYQADWAPVERPADGVYIYKLFVVSPAVNEVLSGKVVFTNR